MNAVNNLLLRMVENRSITAEVGMQYLVVVNREGEVYSGGTIEKVDLSLGPLENGRPIADTWIPDIEDDYTYHLCMRQAQKRGLF